jgi:hypothetical protein
VFQVSILRPGILRPLGFLPREGRKHTTSLERESSPIIGPFFPFFFDLSSFHHPIKSSDGFLNRKAEPGDTFRTEYKVSVARKHKSSQRLQYAM